MASPNQTQNGKQAEMSRSNGDDASSEKTPSQRQPSPNKTPGGSSGDSESSANQPDQDLDAATADLHRRDEDIEKREQSLAEREARCQETEQALQKRGEAIRRKEADYTPKAENLTQREADLKRQQEDVSAREEKAIVAEKRLKKVKNSGPADLLAAQQENDRLRDELAKLRDTLAQEQASTKSLTSEIEQLRKNAQQPQHGASGLPISTAGKTTLRKPQKLTPPSVTPKQARPATKPPSGFTPTLTEKMDAGRKSLAALRERRPPQTAVV